MNKTLKITLLTLTTAATLMVGNANAWDQEQTSIGNIAACNQTWAEYRESRDRVYKLKDALQNNDTDENRVNIEKKIDSLLKEEEKMLESLIKGVESRIKITCEHDYENINENNQLLNIYKEAQRNLYDTTKNTRKCANTAIEDDWNDDDNNYKPEYVNTGVCLAIARDEKRGNKLCKKYFRDLEKTATKTFTAIQKRIQDAAPFNTPCSWDAKATNEGNEAAIAKTLRDYINLRIPQINDPYTPCNQYSYDEMPHMLESVIEGISSIISENKQGLAYDNDQGYLSEISELLNAVETELINLNSCKLPVPEPTNTANKYYPNLPVSTDECTASLVETLYTNGRMSVGIAGNATPYSIYKAILDSFKTEYGRILYR